MKRIYVCSRLRGPDGQPDPKNIERAKRLMRAVFTAGHAPFAPHLLYPQVLTESSDDLALAFQANFAFLDTCDEMWVDAHGPGECSRGMLAELEHVLRGESMTAVVFMPREFDEVTR